MSNENDLEEVKLPEDPEEYIIPPQDETETPAPSSEAEKPAEEFIEEVPEGDGQEETESTEETENSESVPEPVEGESPRERALRLEVERVKRKLRVERGQKLLGDVQPQVTKSELSDEDKKLLEAYNPEEVENLEKVFTVLAKKQGYVKKDEFTKESYAKASQDVFDNFMESHPEYSEENDPDGILWNRFKDEFNLYQKPANPKDFTRIFNKVHNEIFGITSTPKTAPTQMKAKQEKLRVASHGPSSASPKQRTAENPNAELSRLARSGAMKGFSEEELKEMGL